MPDVKCPYCGSGEEINHDDGYGYAEDIAHQQQCGECEKTFVYYTQISFDYYPRRADCLNGEPHRFEPTFTVPIKYSRMECKGCEKEREPTPEEMVLIVKERHPDLAKALNELYTDEEIAQWLYAPQPLFDNQITLDMISAGEEGKITDALNRLLEGVYI